MAESPAESQNTGPAEPVFWGKKWDEGRERLGWWFHHPPWGDDPMREVCINRFLELGMVYVSAFLKSMRFYIELRMPAITCVVSQWHAMFIFRDMRGVS